MQPGDVWGGELNTEWVDELRRELDGVVGRYDLTRACLQFAVRVSPAQDVYGAFDDGTRRAIKRLAGGVKQEIVPRVVVDELIEIVVECDKPGLAAWLIARSVSVACGADFSGSASALPDEYVLAHLSPVIEPSGPLLSLYGSLSGLSSSVGEERDRANPSRVPGLALWVEGPETEAIEVTVDRVGGRRFDACVSEDGLTVALVQPNVDIGELTIDSFPDSESETPEFFGVHPKSVPVQTERIDEALKLADENGATILVVPELSTFENAASELADRKFDNLRVVVSGSYHHVDEHGQQRNSIQTHFVGEPKLTRRHSKTGIFALKVTEGLRKALGINELRHEWMDGRKILEQVVPSFKVRVFMGERVSCVVLICSDFLDRSVQAAIGKLRPSVVLISSMTPKVDVFVNQAVGLVGSCQSTTILVNNPRAFCELGAVSVLPVADRKTTVLEVSMKGGGSVALLNTRAREMRVVGETAR